MAHILVVEDDRDTRISLQRVLEAEGYKVFAASNGLEGLALLHSLSTPCLVLLDLMMPYMNGEEFLEAKNNLPNLAPIPVVAMSAHEPNRDKLEVEDVIRKPFRLDALLKAVKTHCN